MTLTYYELIRFIFGIAGLLLLISFAEGIYPDVFVSVAIFVAVSAYIVKAFVNRRIGITSCILWTVYALPFIHIIPYLWYDFSNADPDRMWALSANPYMKDYITVKLTAMIGAVGALGFAVGLSVKSVIRGGDRGDSGTCSLSVPVFSSWALMGIVLAKAAVPVDTIFTAEYANSTSMLQYANFNSAWMISHVILLYCVCDSIFDSSQTRQRIKTCISLGAVAIVFFGSDLVTGNRESVTLVFVLFLVYYYWLSAITGRSIQSSKRWILLLVSTFILIFISESIGTLRNSLVGIQDVGALVSTVAQFSEAGRLSINNLINGTWNAVLLTPLSVAGDYVNGFMEFKWGKTYLDILLSFPPGFVADAIGYVRPLDIFELDPPRQMRYGLGGVHATVVPFMNFGMVGVFIIIAWWTRLISDGEKRIMNNLNIHGVTLLGTVAMTVPHWIWYGEKMIINALLIWGLLVLLYKFCLFRSIWASPPRQVDTLITG